MQPLTILLGIPSSRGSIMSQTVFSLMGLSRTFHELGIAWNFLNIDAAEISFVRNTMASLAYHRKEVTHLLFIDDDMTFEPEAVVDLLRANKPIVGCICPKRSIDLARVYESARVGEPRDIATLRGLNFITKALPDGRIEMRDGLAQLSAIGMGVTLIRRDVLDAMVARGVAKPRRIRDGLARDDLGNERLYGFFDPIVDESDDSLSEDVSFCRRWTQEMGGEVWGLGSRPIGHIGQMTFRGAYLDLAKTGRL